MTHFYQTIEEFIQKQNKKKVGKLFLIFGIYIFSSQISFLDEF